MIMIPLNLPKIGDEEIQAVVEVMKGSMLTSGLRPSLKITELEKNNYDKFAGVKHAIAVSTGTAALHEP
jgi:perosamine synthetase